MRKIVVLFGLIVSLFWFNQAEAQNTMWIHNNDGTVTQKSTSEVEKIEFSPSMQNMLLFQDGTSSQIDVSSVNYITFSSLNTTDNNGIYIHFMGDTAVVSTSVESENLIIETIGADVTITSKMKIADLNYYAYGTSNNGSLTIKNDKDFNLILTGLNLTCQNAVPIKSSKEVICNIILSDGTYNEISDSENNAKKPVISTAYTTNIKGNGSLVVNSNKKNGISCDKDINIIEGTLTVNINGDAGKGIKADSVIVISGGNITCHANGNIVLDAVDNGHNGVDPSYCAAVSSDDDIIIKGGVINITSLQTASASRGIKADGNIFIYGGEFNITNNSDGGTYTDTLGEADSYKASCIKADGDIYLYGGLFNLTATGTAGKCVTSDGKTVFGYDTTMQLPFTAQSLVFNASTTGQKILVSQGTGFMDDADYSNPKAVKAKGNLYVYSGLLNITTQNDGGEGLESKDTLFINGGETVINTYDDAINAKNHIQVNGGKTFARATGNDGIDCNGTMEFNGGLTIAIGVTSPEEGFDCDNNQFKITGGILVGVGGGTSTPTSNVCTQNSLIYKSLNNSTALRIEDSDGNGILTFDVPTISSQQGQGGPGGNGGGPGGNPPGGGPGGPGGGPGGNNSNGLTLLFSSPNLVNGTYIIKQGGTISSSSSDWNGYYDNASYSSGNSSSVTISQRVTTVQ